MRLYLIGGFLGSGKTTAIRQACLELLERKEKVGVVTNDQGAKLIDSALMKASKLPALEVPNGCFCCNYEHLNRSIQSLQEIYQAKVIFAESVGSCTDLIATVVKPLAQFHPEIEVLVTVFADARALPSLMQDSRLFADSVNYIYKKQLEEADVLIVNKKDLLSAKQLEEVKQLVEMKYPGIVVLFQNSLERVDIQQWLDTLKDMQSPGVRKSLELDYDIYGAGEAELAWYDGEIEVHTSGQNAIDQGSALINSIYRKVNEMKHPIGHLKFLLEDGKRQHKISFTSTTPVDFIYTPGKWEATQLNLLVNARVQTTPEKLKELVSEAIQELRLQTGCYIIERKVSAFRPGYPKPTHRILDEQ